MSAVTAATRSNSWAHMLVHPYPSCCMKIQDLIRPDASIYHNNRIMHHVVAFGRFIHLVSASSTNMNGGVVYPADRVPSLNALLPVTVIQKLYVLSNLVNIWLCICCPRN